MEQKRDTVFAERIATAIWDERATPGDPWSGESVRLHGYALTEMVARLNPLESSWLLLKGELPEPWQAELLRRFMVAFCNPGPRHAATRAVMNAAASATTVGNLPALGLAVLSGAHLGSEEVEQAASFIRASRREDPLALAARLCETQKAHEEPGERRIAPGFGTLYGRIDRMALALAAALRSEPQNTPVLDWCDAFAAALARAGCGWLMPGLAAAVATELDFRPRAAGLLFQLANLPGLIAHALEMSGRGISAMPFVPDERYELIAGDGSEGTPP